MEQIDELNKKIDRGRGLLLDGHIEGGDFHVFKNDCNKRMEILEAKLNDLNLENAAVLDMEKITPKSYAKH